MRTNWTEKEKRMKEERDTAVHAARSVLGWGYGAICV